MHKISVLIFNVFKTDIFLLPCPIKYVTGLDCPGCGFQRSLLALLKGDLAQSFSLYPPTLFLLLSFICGISAYIFKYNSTAKWIKSIYFITGAVIFINYVYKILTHQIV
jgi:hypothetical protein